MSEFYGRLEKVLARGRDVSAAEGLEPGNRWNDMITAVCTFISGAELQKMSARDFIDYDDSEVNWTIIEGYGATIADAGKELPAIFDCPVRRIDHSGKRLKIETAKGPMIADRAILTVPTSIIAENETLFAPALPDKIAAARDPATSASTGSANRVVSRSVSVLRLKSTKAEPSWPITCIIHS